MNPGIVLRVLIILKCRPGRVQFINQLVITKLQPSAVRYPDQLYFQDFPIIFKPAFNFI